MKKILPLALLALLAACDKETETVSSPAMEHRELQKSFEYNSSYSLDVNGDTKDDFLFTNVMISDSRGEHNLFLINPLQENEVLQNYEGEYLSGRWLTPLEKDAEVTGSPKNQTQWSKESGYMLDLRTESEQIRYYEGPIMDQDGELYLGIKLKEGEKENYGWLRLTYVVGGSEIEVREVAYNPAQAGAIKAGQR